MKRLFLIMLSALPVAAFGADEYFEYGMQVNVPFVLYDPSSGAYSTSETDDGDDVQISCNEGSFTTATNDYDDVGGGLYYVTLTATEMQCARLVVWVSASLDQIITIQTYGHASAQHEVFPANVKQMNDAEVCGDGDDAPWTGDCD